MERLVDVLVDGFYGSCGKGNIVSHIAANYGVHIRVGGPNAGHSVVFDGVKSVFYQIPSGAIHAPNATLVIGPGANIHVPTLKKEIQMMEDQGVEVRSRLCIDPQANVITEQDINLEAGLVKTIGSTGQGVGKATSERIMGRQSGRQLARDNEFLKPFLQKSLAIYEQAYRAGIPMLLEGTQGTGLSLYHGSYPYVTSRDTTASGTAGEAGIAPTRVRDVIVVLRSYVIRVASPEGGTSGPMYKEQTWEDISKTAKIPADVLRERERTTTTKRLRRVGLFDWSLLSQALLLNGATKLALTFADYLNPDNANAKYWDDLGIETRDFVRKIEAYSGVPVDYIACSDRNVIDTAYSNVQEASKR